MEWRFEMSGITKYKIDHLKIFQIILKKNTMVLLSGVSVASTVTRLFYAFSHLKQRKSPKECDFFVKY